MGSNTNLQYESGQIFLAIYFQVLNIQIPVSLSSMFQDTDFGFSDVSMDKLDEDKDVHKTKFKQSLESLASDRSDDAEVNNFLDAKDLQIDIYLVVSQFKYVNLINYSSYKALCNIG